MAILDINWNPDRRQIRQFAAIWIVFFAALGGLAWIRGQSVFWSALFGCVAAIGLVEYFRPGFMRPIYLAWMYVAFPIGWIISHLLLLAVYYLILTPTGLVMRLFGYDPMRKHFDATAKTYWTACEASSDSANYFKQY